MRNSSAGRRPAIAVLLLSATITLLLVANSIVFHNQSQRDHHEREVVVLAGAHAFHFDELPEMVATSATVIRGTVVGAARGGIIDEDEVTYTRRLLVIQVDETLAGQPVSGQVTVETAGWRQVDGEAETELRGADEIPVTTGPAASFSSTTSNTTATTASSTTKASS